MTEGKRMMSIGLTLCLFFIFGSNVVSEEGCDDHGISEIYETDTTASKSSWSSLWSSSRTLDSAHEVDPNDSRMVMRGSGSIEFANGFAKMTQSPRAYISKGDSSADGWGNVEITAYGEWLSDGNLQSYSGLTMVARSNHDVYSTDPCGAAGYYARIYKGTGEAAFQKEYYHDSSTIYSPSDRVQVSDWPNGLPNNEVVGMKFVIFTVPETSNVKLELYLDRTNGLNGGDWKLEHSYTDIPDGWLSSKEVPSACPIQNGDTILRAGSVCFLRIDGNSETQARWSRASVRHITSTKKTTINTCTPVPTMPPVPAPAPTYVIEPGCEDCSIFTKGKGCNACSSSGCKFTGKTSTCEYTGPPLPAPVAAPVAVPTAPVAAPVAVPVPTAPVPVPTAPVPVPTAPVPAQETCDVCSSITSGGGVCKACSNCQWAKGLCSSKSRRLRG